MESCSSSYFSRVSSLGGIVESPEYIWKNMSEVFPQFPELSARFVCRKHTKLGGPLTKASEVASNRANADKP